MTRTTYRYSIKSPDRTEQSERIESHTASHCRKNFIFFSPTYTHENRLVLITCIIEPREDYSYGFWTSLLQRRQRKQRAIVDRVGKMTCADETKSLLIPKIISFIVVRWWGPVPQTMKSIKVDNVCQIFFVGLRSSNRRFLLLLKNGLVVIIAPFMTLNTTNTAVL